MMRVCNFPGIREQRKTWAGGSGGGPVHHQVAKAKYLARLGWETVESWPADVVHVHGPVTMNRGIDVLTIHAWWPVERYPKHPSFWDDQNTRQVELVRRARIVVALSEYTDAAQEYLGGTRGQAMNGLTTRVIPQAFDAEEWQDVARGRWRQGGLAGYADRLWVLWGKSAGPLCRPHDAVELARRHPDVIFILTSLRDEVEALAGELPANAVCVGQQPFGVYQELLVDCDAYLATTLEASGQGQLEAMHCGVPVVGWQWGGVAETVEDFRHGRLALPGEINTLSEGLEWVLLRRRTALSRECHEHAGEFTWERIAPRYAELYREIM